MEPGFLKQDLIGLKVKAHPFVVPLPLHCNVEFQPLRLHGKPCPLCLRLPCFPYQPHTCSPSSSPDPAPHAELGPFSECVPFCSVYCEYSPPCFYKAKCNIFLSNFPPDSESTNSTVPIIPRTLSPYLNCEVCWLHGYDLFTSYSSSFPQWKEFSSRAKAVYMLFLNAQFLNQAGICLTASIFEWMVTQVLWSMSSAFGSQPEESQLEFNFVDIFLLAISGNRCRLYWDPQVECKLLLLSMELEYHW